MADRLFEQFYNRVCFTTIKNWLDGKLFLLEALRPQVGSLNSNYNKIKHRDYVQRVLEIGANGRIHIWIDECNFNLYCRRKKGRSEIGHRAHIIVPTSKGNNLHCIGAMSSTQIISFEHRRGSCMEAEDCDAYNRFTTVLQPEEDVEVLLLVSYSYLLNPIEPLWSSFRSRVKNLLREQTANK